MKKILTLVFAASVALASAQACDGDSDETTSPQGGSTSTTTPDGGGGTTLTVGGNDAGGNATAGGMGGYVPPPPPTEEAPCLNQTYDCGDLEDNDGDGLIDYQDPDCLGPCDNTEGSLYGGIPGQAGPPCKVDCYFDSDSGSGNDECYWDHICDPLSVPPDYYPEPAAGAGCAYDDSDPIIPPTGKRCTELDAAQLQECYDYCGPLTPNGCDCFGCCELPAGSGEYVWLGSEGIDSDNPTQCTFENLADPTICHPCTPVDACLNDCDECELCLGKTVLPPECNDPECPGGQQQCGTADSEPCPSGTYCVTGCCQLLPQ